MESKNIHHDGYQPKHSHEPMKSIKEGYQPTTKISSKPPNKGTSVQPTSKNK
jgi:hypothetical protein